MYIGTNTRSMQEALQTHHQQNHSIAFVPTMGNLHEGHLSLIKHAKTQADKVVVSIFVNPLQFGANEDLDKYPRTLEQDKALLLTENVDYLFTPSVEDIYPLGMQHQTTVCVPDITRFHCGASRPGHFDGVSTVVMKLFNIIQPTTAIFGQKDFQQLAVIKKMVNDLCIPITIIGAPTGRASDMLALSSRNQYLSANERSIAPLLYQQLLSAKAAFLSPLSTVENIQQECIKNLISHGFRVDYFTICDALTLEAITATTRDIVILAASHLGNTRLIDNISFSIEP